jgi:hypothetical protein
MSDFKISTSSAILCAALQLWLNETFIRENVFISVDSVSLSFNDASFKVTVYNNPHIPSPEEEE